MSPYKGSLETPFFAPSNKILLQHLKNKIKQNLLFRPLYRILPINFCFLTGDRFFYTSTYKNDL